MANVDKSFIFVNFEGADPDGAIWLPLPARSFVTMDFFDFIPEEGKSIVISDGDVEVDGVIQHRDGRYVVIPTTAFRDVRK